MNNWHLKQIMKPKLGTIYTRFLKKKTMKKKAKKVKQKLPKRKVKQKGTGKRCWCGRPAISNGYCAHHL